MTQETHSRYYNETTTSHQPVECFYQQNHEEDMAAKGNMSNERVVYLEKKDSWGQVNNETAAFGEWSQQYLNFSHNTYGEVTQEHVMADTTDQQMMEETSEDDSLVKKNLRERERIRLINDSIDKLQVLVPRDAGERTKRSKAKLLSSAVDYIIQLEKTLHQLRNNQTTGAESSQMPTQTAQHQDSQFQQNGGALRQ